MLPLAIYLVQLVLNAAWTLIFFGLHRPDLAFIEIVVLWLSIVATMTAFHPVNAVAAWLLLPYLLWVTLLRRSTSQSGASIAGQFQPSYVNANLSTSNDDARQSVSSQLLT